MVTGALHFSSKDKLNVELGWESIQKLIEFLGLSLFHKIHLRETRPLIRQCMSKLDYEKRYEMRSKGGYSLFCLVEHHIPHFIRMNKNSNLNLLLNGFTNYNSDYYHLNSTITKAGQTLGEGPR